MPDISEQGNIVIMDFSPQAGHEQAGRRPALVVSNARFHHYTNMTLVCPITHNDRDFPLHIPLDNRTVTTGMILCEQIRSADLQARNARFVEKAPSDLVQQVLLMINAFY